MRYLIRFSYDGTLFNGFQRQSGLRTIQEEMEEALKKINNNQDVKLVAAGRTDKGVHAFDQVAHVDIDVNITPYKLKRAMNSNLSDEIHVNEVFEVNSDYNVRGNVAKKVYQYRINTNEFNPLRRNYCYQHGYSLDIDKMRNAIKYFVGKHDFRAFVTENKVKENCVREIYEATIEYDEVLREIVITFIGSGFLRYQVRNMVGLLLRVGTLKVEEREVKKILDSKVRGCEGVTAKSCGLYLVKTILREDL